MAHQYRESTYEKTVCGVSILGHCINLICREYLKSLMIHAVFRTLFVASTRWKSSYFSFSSFSSVFIVRTIWMVYLWLERVSWCTVLRDDSFFWQIRARNLECKLQRFSSSFFLYDNLWLSKCRLSELSRSWRVSYRGISQQDIDNFKAEIEKRQKEHSPDSGEAVAIAEKDIKKDDKDIKKATEKNIEKVEQKATKDLEASKISALKSIVAR